MAMDEEILVVPRERLLMAHLHGFSAAEVEDYLARVRAYGVFQPRREMEDDPTMKQIIPYLIVRHGARLFLFQRSSAGGEARLHGLYSIGVGGHINHRDVVNASDLVAAALRRELEEELIVEGDWQSRLVGVLNDDSNPVGRVHFGLVHVVETESPAITVRESEAMTGRLADSREVLGLRDRMETWSQIIVDTIDPMAL